MLTWDDKRVIELRGRGTYAGTGSTSGGYGLILGGCRRRSQERVVPEAAEAARTGVVTGGTAVEAHSSGWNCGAAIMSVGPETIGPNYVRERHGVRFKEHI
jgi:hypothetical protein